MNASFVPPRLASGLSIVALALLFAAPPQVAEAKGPPKGRPETTAGSMNVEYHRSTEVHVNLTGAAAILSLRDELGLTDEQVERLQAIIARQELGAKAQPPTGMEAKMQKMMKEMEAKKGPTGKETQAKKAAMEAKMKKMMREMQAKKKAMQKKMKAKKGPMEKEMQAKKAAMEAKMKKMMAAGEKPMAMPKSMMLQCQLVMEMKVAAADPAVALALRKPLKLTDEQTARLEKIRDRARRQTEEVLKDAQTKQLDQAVGSPTTFIDLYVKMLKDMEKMMDGATAGQPKGK